jgi:MraZ protein
MTSVTRFFGRYEHTLDNKGRLILPARFREPFGHGGYLTAGQDGCLALWTPDEFDQQMEAMAAGATASREQRQLARVWASSTTDVALDNQGRIVVPVNLRQFARLDGAVLVMGAIQRVELWDPSVWDDKVQGAERVLLEN